MKISRSLRRTWWPLAAAAFHAIALAVALAVFVFLISAEGFHGSWHESNLLKPTAAVLERNWRRFIDKILGAQSESVNVE